LPDGAEVTVSGSNPLDPDTDDDSLLDGVEVTTYGTSPLLIDTDADSCGDSREVQTAPGSQMTGGLRSPLNQYDYFNPTHDGRNRIDDVVLVVGQYFKDLGNPLYTAATDRVFAGPMSWHLGAPDGRQRVDDILNAIRQYFHDCSVI
jgi:hypothetical protein